MRPMGSELCPGMAKARGERTDTESHKDLVHRESWAPVGVPPKGVPLYVHTSLLHEATVKGLRV